MALSNAQKRALFIQYVGVDLLPPDEAAWRAGYGAPSKPNLCEYHKYVANKLLKDDRVVAEIEHLKNQQNYKETIYPTMLKNMLKRCLENDVLKYYASSNTVLPSGRTVTDFYLKKQVEEWDVCDREFVVGFDSQGRPKFMDKTWALEKLLKIYEVEKDESKELDALVRLYDSLGLTTKEFPFATSTGNISSQDEMEYEAAMKAKYEAEADAELVNGDVLSNGAYRYVDIASRMPGSCLSQDYLYDDEDDDDDDDDGALD